MCGNSRPYRNNRGREFPTECKITVNYRNCKTFLNKFLFDYSFLMKKEAFYPRFVILNLTKIL